MQKIIDYIEKSCSGLKDNQVTYCYKRKLLDGMTQRADEMIKAGLKDEKVILDLIADEYGDIEKGFASFLKERKKENRKKLMKVAFPVGGLIFIILLFITYFSVSGLTLAWDKTWLIIVGGIFAMIIFYLSFAINKLCHMRRVFHPIARVLIVGCVMLFMVFLFLFQCLCNGVIHIKMKADSVQEGVQLGKVLAKKVLAHDTDGALKEYSDLLNI